MKTKLTQDGGNQTNEYSILLQYIAFIILNSNR
jgi:hypothetical protein